MRLIIAGSRGITDFDEVSRLLNHRVNYSKITPSQVLCGEARGVDRLGEQWAVKEGIEVKYFPANWQKYGKAAGYKRNIEMALNADVLIAIWNGQSPGTRHMISIAQAAGLKVFIERFEVIA